MHRYLKVLFLLLPFFMLACPAPKNSGADAASGVEDPKFDNVSEVVGPNGSLWEGKSQDARYKLTFDMRKDGWTGVIRIEDSQAPSGDTMHKFEALVNGTKIEDGNVIVFTIMAADNGWHVLQARLKVTGEGKGLGTVHIKENNLSLVDVPLVQNKK